jgi:hypothetical protein
LVSLSLAGVGVVGTDGDDAAADFVIVDAPILWIKDPSASLGNELDLEIASAPS